MPTPRSNLTAQTRSELEAMAWPELDSAAIEHLRNAGRVEDVDEGDVLFEVGQQSYDFIYVEQGSAHIIDRANDQIVITIHGPSFLGELGLLMGQGTFLAGVAAEPSRVIIVAQSKIQELIATVPEISDAVVSAFAARRRLLIEWGEGGLTIIGNERDPESLRLLEFASRNRLPYRFVERGDETAVAETMSDLRITEELPPDGTIVISGRSGILHRPTPLALAEALGMHLEVNKDEFYDLAVVGAGPAGLAAAVYSASEGLCTLVIEDTAIGGQAGTSSRIENYLGFPTGISGADLAFQGEIQAIKFGARITVPRRAVSLRKLEEGFEVGLDDSSVIRSRAVVLANGVQYRRLPIENLERFEGVGVYYAATHLEARLCDGADVIIIGGGNSAGQAAMFLSRHARCTHIVVRGEGLSNTMSSYLSDRIDNDPQIKLVTHTEVTRLHGDERLEAVTLRDRNTGEESVQSASAVFIMVGAAPNTQWLQGVVDLDEKGFIKTGGPGDPFATSTPGIYAVGDIRAGSVKRVASAVGEGSVVISSVHRFLSRRRG